MAQPSNSIADQLLEQHVKHELAALKGAKLRKFLEQEADELLALGERVTLNRASSVEQVMGVIERIVMNMELGAGIPELAAASATRVINAPVQSQTPLKDILSREQMAGFVEEALELRHQRERVISEVISHPVYQELVSSLVYHGLVNYLYEDNYFAKKVPGVGSAMKLGKRWANKAVPGLDETFEKNIKAWLNKSLPGLIQRSEDFLLKALDDEEMHDTVMAAWVSVENRTVAELRDGMGDTQLQEFVVLGYEFWLKFRQTAYFQACCRAVVEHVFEQYGDEPLTMLLTDLGIDRALIHGEIEALALPLVDLLREEGYLEALLRRRLKPFYHSAAVSKILAQEK
ncbi:hypothetical protein QQM79_14535 [Marinobacteraceae bacterium S3BR75-40.1]